MMRSKFTNDSRVQRSLLIFIVIIIFTAILPIFLLLLSWENPATTTGSEMMFYNYILPIILISMSIIEIYIVFKFLLPRAEAKENFNDALASFLLISVIIELIGIFALLMGLLQLFVVSIQIRWDYVFLLVFLSVGFNVFITLNRTYPKLTSFNELRNSNKIYY